MFFYDCKIFKSLLFSKELNEVLSSFIIRYKEKIDKNNLIKENIY
jgi:hypothetical protein